MGHYAKQWRGWLPPLVVIMATLGGCASDSETADSVSATEPTAASDRSGDTPSTTAPDDPLRILVTNDDGIGAEGIAAISDALAALDGVEVTIVAPAENQSGSGGKTTAGELVVVEATTATGRPGTSVAGFPADSVIWALDQGGLGQRPDLVVSGINFGQNIGPAVPISGTIGAARAAAARGIPALAVSQGIGEPADFPSAVVYVLAWLSEHRDALGAGTFPVGVISLNVPTCTAGAVRPPVSVPVGANSEGRDLAVSDCTIAEPVAPIDDVSAFTQGLATLTDVGLG